MRLLLARTSAEAHLYLALTPCFVCAEIGYVPPGSGLITIEGAPHSRYAGTCPGCGSPVEFVFRVPLDPVIPDPDQPTFGGEDRSEMLDAGQWVWYADRVTDGSPGEPDGEMTAPQRQQVRWDLLRAAAALSEALKFVTDGADEIPREALWSELGRSVYARDPGRFRRRRLEAARRTYHDLAQQFR